MMIQTKTYNYLVELLNKTLRTSDFQLCYYEYEDGYYTIIEYKLYYKNKTFITCRSYVKNLDKIEYYKEDLKRQFDITLFKEIIFSKPTNGEFTDVYGFPLINFADIKEELIKNIK
jgi:hypothetical protein